MAHQVSTPLDIFLRGYLKNRVYKTAVNDIDNLKEKIQEAVRSVIVEMIAATWRELCRHLTFMVENKGDN